MPPCKAFQGGNLFMKKRWTAMLLALTLCVAETLPVTAVEEIESAQQTEDAQAVADMPIESEEIIEEHLPLTETETETELPWDVAEEFCGDELTINLSGAAGDSVIDLPEAADDIGDGLTADAADPWGATPAADPAQTEIPIDADHFPDEKFRDYLAAAKHTVEYETDGKTAYKKVRIDTDENGSLSADEIAAVTEIDVIGKGISDLTGIAYFTALTTLQCDNNALTTLDVGKNTKLECLTCSGNQLIALDLKSNASLFSLVCTDNRIETLDLSKNSRMQDLRCAGNQLQSLDLSRNSILTWLDCSENQLSALDVSKHTSLTYLFCNSNQLTGLNVSGASKLQWLDCSGNRLTELDVTGVLNVRTDQDAAVNLLNCADNRLTTLDVSNKNYFKGLICSNNAITGLDLSTDPDLRQLECANNALTSLDVAKNTKLQTLDCSGNQLTSLDLSKLSITETTVLPNCSGQKISINLTETDSGYQADLNPIIGNSSLLRLTKEELLADSCTAKSVKGSLFLLTQEGELADGVLSFTKGVVPETIELACATGYRKKSGEADVLLEIRLHCHTHTYVELSKTEPSCTEDGLLRKECTTCGTIIETIFPANGHDYRMVESKVSTCTENGFLLKQCLICKGQEKIIFPATGHKYGEFTVTRAATIFAEGAKSRTCSVCGNVETETIPKLDGTVELAAGSMPIQVKEKVSVQSLVTGLKKGDYVTTWSSDNPKIATVSKDGTITAKKNGTANISVTTKSGATTTMAVKVQKNTVTTKAITGLKKNVSLNVGKTLKLKPVLTPISSQQKITYKSSNTKIAKISSKGVVSALKKGTAKITVKSGSKKYVVKVKVVAPAVKSIKNIPAKKTLRKGKTYQLKPKLTPTGCSTKVTFKSSNKKVASVTASGKIKAKEKGTAKITVTAGKIKKVCKIIVK